MFLRKMKNFETKNSQWLELQNASQLFFVLESDLFGWEKKLN